MSEPIVSFEEMLRAILAADNYHRHIALRVLHGDLDFEIRRSKGPLLLPIGVAAKFLGVSRGTLDRVFDAGRLKRVELYPGAYRVSRDDVEQLAESRRVQKRRKTKPAPCGG